jgi:hypothetical protein
VPAPSGLKWFRRLQLQVFLGYFPKFHRSNRTRGLECDRKVRDEIYRSRKLG